MATVAICIPAYNSADNIRRLLDSISIQTFIDYEVYIMDDSVDNTVLDAVRGFSSLPIIYKKNSSHLGATQNTDQTLLAAEGGNPKYLKVMHHDDWFANSTSLADMVTLMEEEPDAIIGFCGSNQVSKDGKYSRSISDDQLRRLQDDYRILSVENSIGGPSATIVKNMGVHMDPQLTWLVDVDWYMSLLSIKNRFVFSKDPLINIGISDFQLSNKCVNDIEIQTLDYLHVYYKHGLNSSHRFVRYRDDLMKKYIQWISRSIRNPGCDESKLGIIAKKSLSDYERICDAIIKNSDIRRIKEEFGLEYLLSGENGKPEENNKRVAIFAHLYYEDLLEECFQRLLSASRICDVYISTSQGGIFSVISSRISKMELVENMHINMVDNRGHDVGALLTHHASIMKRYEYVCFVHDKKSTHLTSEQYGYDWFRLIWDSTIQSGEYISNVIRLFDNEPRLGLLTVPEPFWEPFLSYIGNSWGDGDYESVNSIIEELGLECVISRESSSLSLSTAFWARYDALEPLFSASYSLSRFPEEGVDNFGYAIERIFPYVAQSKGYYTGVVTNSVWEKTRVSYLERYVKSFNNWLCPIYGRYSEEFIDRCVREAGQLRTISEFKNVYLYGNGNVARDLCKRFPDIIAKITCVVVSDEQNCGDFLESKEVVPISKVRTIDSDSAFIVAVAKKSIRDVENRLSEYGFSNYITV